MSSSFPARALQQAQYDARIGGQGMERNPFQRAQDFLRNKLNPAINPSTATSVQQTDLDARNAKRVIDELQKAKNVKQLRQLGQTGSQLVGLGRNLLLGGSQMLVGDGSQLPLLAAMQTSNTINNLKSKPQTTTKTEIDPKLFPAAVEGGYTISPKVRKELAEERVKPTPVPETITPTAPAYNAKERVKKHGVKKAEDMAMMEWAKAHKGLAEKVKPGQAGYDAIQLALGKTTVEPEEIRGFMDDSGKSAEEARAILGGGSVETVIDGNKPMVTTINPAVAAGGSEVEIPTANFSGMSQAMQDLVGPSLEAGAAFNINVDNVLNQNDPQSFLMEQLKKIQGIKR